MSDETIVICDHIKTGGERCGSPALKGWLYCHFHQRFHDLNDMPGAPDYEVPVLEDSLSIQLFLMQIAKAQNCGSISPAQASGMLKLARAAMQNLRLSTLTPPRPIQAERSPTK